MRKAIPLSTRNKVVARANSICEYCLLSDRLALYSFHIEHIRSLKHGGSNDISNLAYCCPDCNYYKGSDIGTFNKDGETIIRVFNPRKDSWDEHFELDAGAIHGRTEIGNATAQIFKFNEVERLIFRQQLTELGLYR